MDAGSLIDSYQGVVSPVATTRPRIGELRLGGGWKARVLLQPTRSNGQAGLGDAGLTADRWRAWLQQPLAWFPPADKRDVLKTSSTTLVCRARMPVATDKHLEVVCKQRNSRHLHKRMLATVRKSRPRRTWEWAMAMLAAGIPTARPLAVLERRRFGLLTGSLLITEYLYNAVDLESLLTVRLRRLEPRRAFRLKSDLADGLAAFIARVHKAGFIHRDLKALNVIVQFDPERCERPRISVVDLDGMRSGSLNGGGGDLRMLMRLNVSVDPFQRVTRTDRLRVLLRYLARTGRPRAQWKQVWHQLADMSQRKRDIRARHQERSFRKYGRY